MKLCSGDNHYTTAPRMDFTVKIFPLKSSFIIFGALRNLVPCAQLKKREKHPFRSVTFSKVAEACNFTKSSTPLWVFFHVF